MQTGICAAAAYRAACLTALRMERPERECRARTRGSTSDASGIENGIELVAFGLDSAEELARASRSAVDFAICGHALELPFGDRSIDVVMCSQVLHHFSHPGAVELLREMDRVARVRVIVSDLRRSRIAAAGLWLASFPLRFHAVSRHDGVVSVMRGFTPEELVDTVREAVARPATARQRRLFRVTTSWAPRDR